MTLALSGTLPVSAINVGLQASLGGLNLEIAKLTAEIGNLGGAASAKLEVSANFPPDATMFASAVVGQLSVPEVTAQFDPANWFTMGADVSTDIAAKLAAVNGWITTIQSLLGSLGAGLAAGGISGWTYAGRAAGYGSELERVTASGTGALPPDATVSGIVIASESLASWGALAQGVNVGRTAAAPASPADQRLTFLGALGGGQWNTGVTALMGRFELLLDELLGAKLGLEASAQVALGLNLPDVQAQVDAGAAIFADVGIDGLLENLVNVQADVDASIALLNAKIDVLSDLVAELTVSLSAGGLSFWTFSGRLRDLGSELHAALQQGIPGGNGADAAAYGLALVGSLGTMTTFGSVFKTS